MEDDALEHSPVALPPPPAPAPIEIEKDFITSLEALPHLWDKTHTLYCNKYKRNDGLAQLRAILEKIKPGSTVDDVKKKINVLRSNYRRELKKIITSKRSGCGADELYRPKIWTFEYLKFLDKHEQPVPVNNVRGTDSAENGADRNPPHTDEERTATISSMAPVPAPSEKASQLYSKKSVIRKQNELLERACSYLGDSTQVTGGQSIAFEWTETLSRLTPTQRLYAKKAINDILFEAELGNLNRHSVQINVTTSSPTAPTPYSMHTEISSSPSLYSHTPSPNYVYTQAQDIAPPEQSPNYSHSAPPVQSPNYGHCDPPAQSPNYSHSAPPVQSPNYGHCDPPAQSPNYSHSAPPVQSPNYGHCHPPAQSPNYSHSAPPVQSPNYGHCDPPAQSPNYSHSAPPVQSPNYGHCDPPAQSPNYSHSAPPVQSPNYGHCHPPAQSPNYSHSAPPVQSPNYGHCHPPAQSPNYSHSAPPVQSPNYGHCHPPAQSPNYSHSAPPVQSPNYGHCHPPAQSPNYSHSAPPAQSPDYTQPSLTTPSSEYTQPISTEQLSNNTQITPSAPQEYILRIPSRSSLSQDFEYTAGSLFALFKP